MPTSTARREFGQPRPFLADLPDEADEMALRIAGPRAVLRPRADTIGTEPCRAQDHGAYFEIYCAERVNLTSILFSGGDWRWQFCSAVGTPLAAGAGYASERACAAAVAALRGGAATAKVRVTRRG